MTAKNKTLGKIQEVFPQDKDILNDAFLFAAEKHAGQKRKSGEAFIEHPLSVALILAEEGMDIETVVAAILHDTLEDTDATSKDIKEKFGDTILLLVEGITKIEQATEKRDKNYRKMLLAAANDARVILIKLADRVHNLRTIQPLAAERKKIIAKETLQVYAPLAHRLGLSQIKTELEDRSLQITDPGVYEEARMIQEERVLASKKEMKTLLKRLESALKKDGIKDLKASARIKSRFSIAEKLKRKEAEEILDIVGMRVIVPEKRDCYLALGTIHSLWPPLSEHLDDYIAVPRANLYQSLHTTVMTEDGRAIEVQIRTPEMNELAERGIGAHWLYKENLREGGPSSTKEYLQSIARHQEESDLENLFQNLKRDVFQEDNYFFTPRGDIKILPEGSNAIDFAYAIHSDVGNSIAGAKVDGRMQSIKKPLNNGARVEILTKKDGTPSRDWLESVKTNRARSRIRAFFADEIDKDLAKEGMLKISEALERNNLKPLSRGQPLYEALDKIGYPDPEEAGRLAVRNEHFIKKLLKDINAVYVKEEISGQDTLAGKKLQQKKKTPSLELAEGIRVSGMKGVSTRIAGCCNPEPGDPITGYISLGRGISVHRSDCPEIISWQEKMPEKLIEAEWESDPSGYLVHVQFKFLDRTGLLREISETVYSHGGEIKEIDSKSTGSIVRGKMTVRLGIDSGDELREKIKKIQGSLHVGRT
jgi:guanosine-3',5'-bis(diphosphate) 3'-pyrophosphohydrolase